MLLAISMSREVIFFSSWGLKNMKTAARSRKSGFTLVEMVVVLAIAIALMAIMLPALKGLRGDKYSLSATTQLIADFNNARLAAINGGSPVYVVFMPKLTKKNFEGMSDAEKTYFQKNKRRLQLCP